MKNNLKIAFFGSDEFSIKILEELKKKNIIPTLLITVPDKPKGRKLILTSPPTKEWALKRNINTIQPEKLSKEIFREEYDLFIVASFGLIIPSEILNIPKYKSINVHPSLLPLLRGSSPIETAMLQDMKETGVTIMRMDDKMDHGPILNQEIVYFKEWPKKMEVRDKLATIGGNLLAQTIDQWINKEIDEQEQDHKMATYTKKIKKEDGLLDLNNGYKSFLKIKALNPWPGTYFFTDNNKRIKITDASYENNTLKILRVIPEGKKEMNYNDFKKAK